MQAEYTWEGWFSALMVSFAFILLLTICNVVVGTHQILFTLQPAPEGAVWAVCYRVRG